MTVTESISRSKQEWSSELEDTMKNFEQFVESKEDNVDINITAIENKELPFKIVPHNITYSRSWGTGHVKLNVIPESLNFRYYDIIIDSKEINISSMSSKFKGTGDFYFRVRALDNLGYDNTEESYVDFYDNQQIQVFFAGGNKIMFTMSEGALEIWTNVDKNIEIKTTLGYLDALSEKPRIEYSGSILVISFPGLGISMSSPLIPQ